MNTKPNLIRLEPVDPSAVPGANMYIKNEVLYNVETPTQHIVKKEDAKVYYEGNSHHSLQETKAYIPDTVHSYQTKPISQYPKYQTPKLRAKSTYSPIKAMTTNSNTSQHIAYMKQEPTDHIMMGAAETHPAQHLINTQQRDYNAKIQVITPNTNYVGHGGQQWQQSDVNVMAPTVMEQQTLQQSAGDVSGNAAPDAIFIPETGGISSNENSSNYNAMNAAAAAATINVIPVMTPNGLVFVAAGNNSSGSVIRMKDYLGIHFLLPFSSGVSPNNTVDTIPTATPTPQQQSQTPSVTSRSYNRRKQVPKRTVPVPQPTTTVQPVATHVIETVSPEMQANVASNASNVVYTPNGQVLLLNENRVHQQLDFKPVINTPAAPLIPEKGTVIEEPPKAIYQSRYSDINENSTQYNSKSGGKSVNVCSDAELDLDAAITVFKIYK